MADRLAALTIRQLRVIVREGDRVIRNFDALEAGDHSHRRTRDFRDACRTLKLALAGLPTGRHNDAADPDEVRRG